MAKQGTYPRGNRMTAPKRRIMNKRRGPLALWLKENRITLTAFSTEVDCSVQHISNLIHQRTRRPSLELAVAIERATGGAVKVSSWGK